MFERLDQIEARYEELTNALASPDIVNDSARYQKTAKAHAEIAPMVEKYREYRDLTKGIAESKAVLVDEKDAEMRAYAQEELDKLEARVGAVEEELKVLRIHYQRLAEMAKSDMKITESHSIEEAVAKHNFKRDRRKKQMSAS